jgi:vacuolar-type H+-ATPase subunit H
MGVDPKKNLALDALQKIKEAEAEARKIVEDAQDKTSVKIIQDAYEDANQIKERVLLEARKQAQEKKESIIQSAKIEVKEIEDEIQAGIDRLQKISSKRRNQAVAKVAESIRRVIEGGEL